MEKRKNQKNENLRGGYHPFVFEKEVQMKGLIPFELVEVALFEACKDFSVAN